jgi:hypothetical protein
MQVSDLAAGASIKTNFTSTLQPVQGGLHRLVVTVDSRKDVVESSRANDVLTKEKIAVTMLGDINDGGIINLFDTVKEEKER